MVSNSYTNERRSPPSPAIISPGVTQVLDYETYRRLDSNIVAAARAQLLPEYKQKFEIAIADHAHPDAALNALLPYVYC